MTDLTPNQLTALEAIVDSGGIFGLPQLDEAIRVVSEAIAEAERTDDVAHAYDNAPALALLPMGEFAKAESAFKRALGKQLNLRDLDRAVRDARRSKRVVNSRGRCLDRHN
ncbi:MAG: hypothetical protein M3546_15520 [Actinomycetota bacterium]|nr:hypothetical protein [Actinomycetota bacterium]